MTNRTIHLIYYGLKAIGLIGRELDKHSTYHDNRTKEQIARDYQLAQAERERKNEKDKNGFKLIVFIISTIVLVAHTAMSESYPLIKIITIPMAVLCLFGMILVYCSD